MARENDINGLELWNIDFVTFPAFAAIELYTILTTWIDRT